MTTLADALETVYRTRWARRRTAAALYSQGLQGVKTLALVVGTDKTTGIRSTTPATVPLAAVRHEHVKKATRLWLEAGFAPATVTKRLGCLRLMGIPISGLRPPKDRKLQWWLNDADMVRLCAHLRESPKRLAPHVADFIEFTAETGLRVEESLRLTWAELDLLSGDITVPGSKTTGSQATLPLSALALSLLKRRRMAATGTPERRPRQVFAPLDYEPLYEFWTNHCRPFLGVSEHPGATLKALRRSAARRLSIAGMPTEVLRYYLRHERIATTEGYLRLVGGYSTEEMRKWVR